MNKSQFCGSKGNRWLRFLLPFFKGAVRWLDCEEITLESVRCNSQTAGERRRSVVLYAQTGTQSRYLTQVPFSPSHLRAVPPVEIWRRPFFEGERFS